VPWEKRKEKKDIFDQLKVASRPRKQRTEKKRKGGGKGATKFPTIQGVVLEEGKTTQNGEGEGEANSPLEIVEKGSTFTLQKLFPDSPTPQKGRKKKVAGIIQP